MGRRRENRLQLRRLEYVTLAAAVVLGAAATPGIFAGDAGRLLVTFLGLVAASILPTISVILGSMTASGRSVKSIDELQVELSAAMDALFLLFGLVGLSVVALVALSIPTPAQVLALPFAGEALCHAGQGVVLASAALILTRAGQIPGILRRSLGIRHRIAVDEARRQILENAAKTGSPGEIFPAHPDFGKSIKLADLSKGRGR
jgi:hypothetical protein